jgi:hypothetical protein
LWPIDISASWDELDTPVVLTHHEAYDRGKIYIRSAKFICMRWRKCEARGELGSVRAVFSFVEATTWRYSSIVK